MMETKPILYMRHDGFWKENSDARLDIAPFVEDALIIERRLLKGANAPNERMRYRLCCRRIQEAALSAGDESERMILDQGYYDVLDLLWEQFPAAVLKSRLTACFFRPESLSEHLNHFKALVKQAQLEEHPDIKKRLDFFEKAQTCGAGVVEVSDFLVPAQEKKKVQEEAFSHLRKGRASTGRHEMEDAVSEERRLGMLQNLKRCIARAIETGGEVNFSNQPHFVVADALNGFVYRDDPDELETRIRVVYMDGSQAEDFPLRCLNRPCEGKATNTGLELPSLKAALISMRHLEMDEIVDMAWFRNRKVSVPRPFAETDAYCTQETIKLLHTVEGGLHIELYQTGLETAVVGFYRGLVEVLKQRRSVHKAPPLRVLPRYYAGKTEGYRAGKLWE